MINRSYANKIISALFFTVIVWLCLCLYVNLFEIIAQSLFENILGAETGAYEGAGKLSLNDLSNSYPNFYWIIWFFLKIRWIIKFSILFIVIAFAYKKFKVIKSYILRFSIIYLVFIFLDLAFSFVLDSGKIFTLPFNGRTIEANLRPIQFTYSDQHGINKLLKVAEFYNQNYSVNKEGFRSGYEFGPESIAALKKRSKVIMVIGDSHTEGCCARPVTKSFTDLLDENEEYTALNFGIGGTDPLQYKLIAENYIAKLHPDVVVIPFCLGNDIMLNDRKPMPYKPLHFQTNYGYLNHTLPTSHPAYEADKYFKNWKEAKKFYIENYTVSGSDNPSLLFRLLIKNSSFNSFMYYLPRHLKLQQRIAENTRKMKANEDRSITYKYIKEVEKICEANQIPFILFGVPKVNDIAKDQEKVYLEYQEYFRDIRLHYPKNLLQKDYTPENDHFANPGHQKFYEFIVRSLKEEL